jgi:hypothetical protein
MEERVELTRALTDDGAARAMDKSLGATGGAVIGSA